MSDKNDLPSWLMDDDDDNQNQSPAPGGNDLPPWLQDDAFGSDEQAGDEFGDVSWESIGGKQDSGQSPISGVTRDLPWRQGVSDGSERPDQSGLADVSWESTGGKDTGDTSLRGVTKELPWRQGVNDSTRRSQEMSSWLDADDQSHEETQPGSASPEIPEWLIEDDEGITEAEADAYTDLSPIADAAEAQKTDEHLPDWLRVDTSSFAERKDESAATFAFEDETESGYGSFEEAHTEDELDWMRDEESAYQTEQASDPYGGMTYDEWERHQEEAQKEPEPQELTELPDWFMNIDQGAPEDQATLDHEGTYMPEWFMGVEELSKDDAPDWLKEPSAPPLTPSSRQAAPPPPMAEVPLPAFDDVFGDLPMPDLEAPLDLGDLLLEDEPEAAPAGSAISMDDLLMEEDDLEPPMPDLDIEPVGVSPAPFKRVQAAPPPPPADDEEALDFDALFAGDTAPAARAAMPAPDELDWMAGETAAAEPGFDDLFPPETPLTGMPAAQSEMPAPDDLDWMSGTPEPAGESASPSWLTDYQEKRATDEVTAFRQTAETEAVSVEPEGIGDFGAWLEDIDLEAPPPVQETPRPAQAAQPMPTTGELEDIDLGDLLGIGESEMSIPAESALAGRNRMELASVDSLSFEEEEDLFKDFTPFEQEMPEMAAAAPIVEPGEIQFGAEEELEPAEAEDVPDWVRTITTAEDTVMLSVGGVTARFEQVPDVVLPANLRTLREEATEFIVKKPLRGEPVNEGPLAGIEGALQLQPDLVKPGSLQVQPIATTTQLSDTQRTHLTALQRVLEIVEAETAAEKIDIGFGVGEDQAEALQAAPVRSRRRVRAKRDRLLVTLILFVAVLLPFLSDALHLADDPSAELDSHAVALAAAIDTLGTVDATPVNVLVAFEYTPTAAQELDPLVEAVLRDVLAHGGRPVIISTDPIGLLNAEHLMAELAQDEALLAAMNQETPLQMPERYVILPYLSGGPIGVRSLASQEPVILYFARDYHGDATNLDINTINPQSFAFAIVAGERPDDVRIWSEQVSQTGLPMFALVTAAADPVTRTYVSAGVYDGMAAGIKGALMYDAARNSDQKAPYEAPDSFDLPDPAVSRWHSLTLGTALAAGLIALGTLYNLVSRLRRRRR